jgi:glycerol-3-phosphate dehydrogenase (NAD(P)+)
MKQDLDMDAVKIAVVGAGSWGTALANVLALKGFQVDLWVYEEEVCRQILELRENQVFLPGVKLSKNLMPSNDLLKVIREKDLLVLVVPSHFMRDVARKIAPHVSGRTVIVSASKGIENQTLLTMSGVIQENLPDRSDQNLAVLSGPTFAREVARQVPSVVTVAARDIEMAGWVQRIFATPYFRVYTNDDMIGVELGGAVKNVIAIASGIIDGLRLGLNTRAALITRGLTEIRRLGLKLGANPRTFIGLAGVGDLILTCTGELSRNYTLGKKIGEGRKLKDILSEMRMVAEGVKTAKSVYNLSLRMNVEMPISQEIYHILYENLSPGEALYRLMTRNLKQELDEQ